MDKIPFLRPSLVKQDTFKNYVDKIEASRWYSNYGPLNALFENRVVNEYFNNTGAVTTVHNATIGLMLAINQVKRPKGRIALMPSFTFSATPLAAMWCGLEPYFIDIREDNWCMNEEHVEDIVERMGDQVAVVVPYATFGTNLDLSFYKGLQQSGIPVVVDAAASFGSVGSSGAFGKEFPGFIVFSFHATKSFGIGEGGLVYSSDKDLIAKIRQAGNFGFSHQRETELQGLNSKISEYTAAVALATLDAFPEKKRLRQQIHQWYLEEIQKNIVGKVWELQKTEGEIAYQFMPILCPQGENNIDYVKLLDDHNIEARTYFSPTCHQQFFFQSFNRTSMAVTDNISTRILSLPLWEEMEESNVLQVIQVLATGEKR